MKRFARQAALAATLLALSVPMAAAQETRERDANAPDEPLWEVRLGGSGLYGPDYPGASDKSTQGVFAPLFIYRGDRIRFGEYGVARAIAAENKTFELDVSLDAAYSANSDDDGLRAGMPDLDYLFQAGPQGIIHLSDTGWTPEGRKEWRIHVPVRAVASTDFSSIDHVGYIAEPQLVYQRKYGGELRSGWSITLFSTFADEGLADYWYEVPAQFATPDRARYDAKSGYISTGVRASWTRELSDRFQLFLTYQGRNFSGASNENSPLLQEDFTHAVSVSFVWKAFQSRQRAKNDDM
ncbi:MipA/OmpV family protein [Henriciella litoralis]|uniref:MipA/OmpV family protein n=1 Tax=Henriciella litoralis TaxID=568102 RepID=UPI000A044054|nr:MipA/OmpV family protein [Henriciella litoralis]